MYPAPAVLTEEAGVERVGWGRCRFVLEEAVTCFGGPCCPCQEMGVTDGLYFPGLCSPAHTNLVLLVHCAPQPSEASPVSREGGAFLPGHTSAPVGHKGLHGVREGRVSPLSQNQEPDLQQEERKPGSWRD